MDMNILLELALILAVTKTFGLLSRKIHLPQVVGALFAGILLGPAVFGLVNQSEIVTGLAEIGVLLLMFSAGLETDLKQLRSSLKSSLFIALIDVTMPFATGFALAYFFGLGILESLFIGIVITTTSISITVETLMEMGKLKSKTGATILSVAVIDDILGVIILSMIIGMGGSGNLSFFDAGTMLAKIFAFFILAWILGAGMHALIEYIDRKHRSARRLSIFSLAFCFFLAFLADSFGIASITGAYIAGLALCSSRAEHYVEEQSTVLSYLFFSPIFFVSVGLHASFSGLNANTMMFALLLFAVAVVSKFAGNALGAFLCKFNKRECAQIGAGMVSRGEVSIIIATAGLSAGFLSANIFSVLIVIIIATSLISPLLLKAAYTEKNPAPARRK